MHSFSVLALSLSASRFLSPLSLSLSLSPRSNNSHTMQFKTLTRPSHIPLQTPNPKRLSPPSSFLNPSLPRLRNSLLPQRIRFSAANNRRGRLITACISPSQEILGEKPEFVTENGDDIAVAASVSLSDEEEGNGRVEVVSSKREELENQSIWKQMKEIVMFSGPATGLWICAPLMSLIDTAVIGQGSSIELAALGPGTVLCDNLSYVFMFLSIATSNIVATALAAKDKNEVQHQISNLLCVGLTCGMLMLLFTKFFGSWAITAFTGPKNAHLVPAANKYVQIRGLAWPAILIGWVAQSASLGMKDSWGPLKALAVSSSLNIIGHVVLCSLLGYGIAGAAWATMVSQVVAAYMMIQSLNNKGYNAFSLSIPSPSELLQIIRLAAPVFITIGSKVAFYSLIIYFATSMGTHIVAGHQIMIQTYSMCVVWGEPLSQTAQSFMPELMYGVNRSLAKARTLLKSLLIIGTILGLVLGTIGTTVPWLFPRIFTSDPAVIQEMHKVLIPFFIALAVTPCTHSLEGTLLAGRDLTFMSLSMSGCFSLGSLLLLLVSSRGYGLPGFWCALVGFQWARFLLSLRRLISSDGVLFSDDLSRFEVGKLKAA